MDALIETLEASKDYGLNLAGFDKLGFSWMRLPKNILRIRRVGKLNPFEWDNLKRKMNFIDEQEFSDIGVESMSFLYFMPVHIKLEEEKV